MEPGIPHGNKTYGVVLLFILALLAYSNSFDAEFHFDDYHQVVSNTNIRSLYNIPRFFTDAGMSSSNIGVRVYRPVTFSSYAVNYALGGTGVFSFHVLNFILHLLNALLVYFAVSAVLKRSEAPDPYPVALIASLVFALHPVATNAVTYITGRAVLLATSFCLLGFLCHMRFRAGKTLPARLLWSLATLLSLILGLLSKEMAASLLLLVFSYDLVFIAPEKAGARGLVRTFAYYIPVLAAIALILLLRMSVQGFATVPDRGRNLGMYLATEARALLVYVRLMFLPVNQNADYAVPYATSVDAYAVAGVLLLAALLYGAYRLRKGWPAAAFFGLWFIAALAPESTLVPRQETIVEYRLYLPLAGFAASMAVLCAGYLRRPRFLRGFVVMVLALFGLLTFHRNSVWATEYTLWSDTARKSPYSARAYANLGQALIGDKRYDEAAAALKRALEINPFYSEVQHIYNDLGRYLYETGRYGEAAEQFKHAIRLDPAFVQAYENLGAAYYKMRRFSDGAEVLERAVKLDPSYAYARKNLAACYMELGRGADALEQMREAARYAPKDFDIVFRLALIYDANGMKGQALSEAKSALSLAASDKQKDDAETFIARLSGEVK